MKLNNIILQILQHKDRYHRNVDLPVYINYNTLPITELHEFYIYIICLIHKFMHHKHLLPKFIITILQRIIKFIVTILGIKMIYIYIYLLLVTLSVQEQYILKVVLCGISYQCRPI